MHTDKKRPAPATGLVKSGLIRARPVLKFFFCSSVRARPLKTLLAAAAGSV
jgi:hypothetical protein